MSDATFDDGREQIERRLEGELESRDAAAVVHAGLGRDPALRYLLSVATETGGESLSECGETTSTVRAVAYDGQRWLVRSARRSSTHPVVGLAEALSSRGAATTVLAPARVPHDAALHLENAGFDLASTDVVARARATKTTAECDRIASAQGAASAGVRRGASMLASAAVADDRLVLDAKPLTASRLRIAIDEAIVAAGGFPDGNTRIDPGADDGTLRPGEPIVVEVAPRETGGYYGSLVRTLVVESEGGRERRAHVGVTHAFRSSEALLTADSESVTAVEADLEAEVRAFGFAEPEDVATDVSGLGLEPRERPFEGGDDVAPGSVVRLEAAARVADERWVRVADVLATDAGGVQWLEAPPRSLEPSKTSQ